MSGRRWWVADLLLVGALATAMQLAVAVPAIRESSAGLVLGALCVLFLPGYAFVAALFPRAADAQDRDGLSYVDRLVLSLGLSVAITPLLIFVLDASPLPIRAPPIVDAIAGSTLVFAAVAALRRWSLPPAERFAIPVGRSIAVVRADRGLDVALKLGVVVCLLVASAGVAYTFSETSQQKPNSGLYLLNATADERAAGDYPLNFTSGEGRPLRVGVENDEHRRTNYTVVVAVSRVTVEGGEIRVQERRELRRFEPTVEAGETWEREHSVAPTMTGEGLHLVYLLYKGDPPAQITRENAYRVTYLSINVSEPNGG